MKERVFFRISNPHLLAKYISRDVNCCLKKINSSVFYFSILFCVAVLLFVAGVKLRYIEMNQDRR